MRIKSRCGQSLIEVTVAVLISAITATGVFSVILSTRYSYAKADMRAAAAIALRSAQEYLKPYVSVTASGYYNPQGIGNYMPYNGNAAYRHIYGESAYALEYGGHNMTFLLKNMPQLSGATLTYTVGQSNCATNAERLLQCRSINLSLNIPDDAL